MTKQFGQSVKVGRSGGWLFLYVISSSPLCSPWGTYFTREPGSIRKCEEILRHLRERIWETSLSSRLYSVSTKQKYRSCIADQWKSLRKNVKDRFESQIYAERTCSMIVIEAMSARELFISSLIIFLCIICKVIWRWFAYRDLLTNAHFHPVPRLNIHAALHLRSHILVSLWRDV